MADPLVRERCDIVIQENKAYSGYLKEYTRVHGLVSITDFRGLDTIPWGNRLSDLLPVPETVASVKLRYAEPERTHVLVNIGARHLSTATAG
ncbi:MAG: hypothetical protein U5K27_02640 [Desulfotignum sp.]|nr:hypothetical protein [Desulfotignum sp.]